MRGGRWSKLADDLRKHLPSEPGTTLYRVVEVLRTHPSRGSIWSCDKEVTLRDLLELDGDELAAVAYALEVVATGEPEEFGPGSMCGDFSGPDQR